MSASLAITMVSLSDVVGNGTTLLTAQRANYTNDCVRAGRKMLRGYQEYIAKAGKPIAQFGVDALIALMPLHLDKLVRRIDDSRRRLGKSLVVHDHYYTTKVPSGAHDAYALGAQVTHNGSVWESTIAANVWEPGTGSLWVIVG